MLSGVSLSFFFGLAQTSSADRLGQGIAFHAQYSDPEISQGQPLVTQATRVRQDSKTGEEALPGPCLLQPSEGGRTAAVGPKAYI